MNATPRSVHDHEDLLERLVCSRDLPEAVSIFFDSVLAPEGIDRALVLVHEGNELRGVLGMGWTEDEVRDLAIPLESDHPLALAYHNQDARKIASPILLEEAEGDYLAVPLTAIDPSEPPLGLMLLRHKSGTLSLSANLLQRIGSFGTVLSRISERDQLIQGHRQLEQQRDLLTAIVNTLPDPVLITDSSNSIILENRRAESLFTTREGDSEGRRRALEINNLLFSSFLTRSTIGGVVEIASSRELNLVDPSEGGDLLFEVLATELPLDVSGERAHISVLRDVTDLKSAATELENQFKRVRQAEMKSSRERDRLNLILENVGDPILVTDDQSNIILMNREAERLFEIPGGTPLRSRIRQDVRANDTKFSSFISDFALSQDATRSAQFPLTTPEAGHEFPAEVVSGKVTNDRGEMTAIVSIIHDLTKFVENERLASELGRLNESLEDRIRSATLELEERNRQLEWQRQELERAYRLKSQFLASMSHELRTPINALLGYTSLMRDRIYGELNQRQDEALTRMYTASQHLLELVNDILDLAKIEAGKMPVHIEPVDVRHVIRELSQTIEPMVRRKSLEYIVDLDPELPLIRTDRTKVKQIVLNLLSNAVKFTHDGSISVTTYTAERAEDGIVIIVKDTGIGIRPDDIEKIFDDFRQVDQSSTREYGGTGLGLSITKKLLHLLGGTIHVESNFGDGSTFTVWLPRKSEEILLDEEISRVAREADEAVVD